MQREWKLPKKKQSESIACREKKSHQSVEPKCNIQMWNIFCSKFKIPATLPRSTYDCLS